ncbi:hypothetical protein O181_052647 [Austropuccinia psidii MF-1]|uniref:Integrase zinc-binding domain-containing protein n=1 Tax=Austropuccinia psidii MF-1 TaxID=1389203 RepID=A0A9Q3E3C0_9BASI|nr:hypothetical protein [Austropuccinia psidii MF-1]
MKYGKRYDYVIFHLLDGILYHITKHTFFIALKDGTLINNILHECHDSVAAGHLTEDRTLDRLKTCSWWPNLKKEIADYCQTCDRFQKANRDTGNKFGIMIRIQEPKSPWEIYRIYIACLVRVYRYRKTPIFLPCHKDDTPMDTAIMRWNKVMSHTGLFQTIISGRDPKFTSALWKNLHNLFGTKL